MSPESKHDSAEARLDPRSISAEHREPLPLATAAIGIGVGEKYVSSDAGATKGFVERICARGQPPEASAIIRGETEVEANGHST